MPIEKIDSLEQAIKRLNRPTYQVECISILKGVAIFLEAEYGHRAKELKEWCESFAECMPYMSSRESCDEHKKFVAELENFQESLNS